ncbi:hypothetical protein [Kitasatospora aureofaciens]|uniref:hypothetical protein n=1 Tax=Kitasatospora aureofaciens TaxID=1894 RepID=UPI000526AA62|nr:hypothetical protein [Kitasatospora aureofaciens]
MRHTPGPLRTVAPFGVALTDDDHQAVRDLTRTLDSATLRQVMSRLERTRTAAFALRGIEQARPVRLVARRSRF